MSTEVGRDALLDARSLQDTMVALVRAFDLHQPEQTPCGEPVPVSQAHALMELARDRALPQHELGGRLRLQRSTVSRLVAQLERRGWVCRDRHEGDARVAMLSLTTAGRAAADQLATARAAKFAELLAAIPDTDRGTVRAGLAVLVEALRG